MPIRIAFNSFEQMIVVQWCANPISDWIRESNIYTASKKKKIGYYRPVVWYVCVCVFEEKKLSVWVEIVMNVWFTSIYNRSIHYIIDWCNVCKLSDFHIGYNCLQISTFCPFALWLLFSHFHLSPLSIVC